VKSRGHLPQSSNEEGVAIVNARRCRTRAVLPDGIPDAGEEDLNRLRRIEAFERVVGSIANGEVPEWETRESTLAWLRELRQGWVSRDSV
jgi:hypothetical protein